MKRYKLKKAKTSHSFVYNKKLYFTLAFLSTSSFLAIVLYFIIGLNNKESNSKCCPESAINTHDESPRNLRLPNKKLKLNSYAYDDFSEIFKGLSNQLDNNTNKKVLRRSLDHIKNKYEAYFTRIMSFIEYNNQILHVVNTEYGMGQKYVAENYLVFVLDLMLLFHDFIYDVENLDGLTNDTKNPLKSERDSFYINVTLINVYLKIMASRLNFLEWGFNLKFHEIDEDIKQHGDFQVFVQGVYLSLNRLLKKLLVKRHIEISVSGDIISADSRHNPQENFEESNYNKSNIEIYMIKDMASLKKFILLSFYPVYFYFFEFGEQIKLRLTIREFIYFSSVCCYTNSSNGLLNPQYYESDNLNGELFKDIEDSCADVFKIDDFEKDDIEQKTYSCLLELNKLKKYVNRC